jgi:hypothetical protein
LEAEAAGVAGVVGAEVEVAGDGAFFGAARGWGGGFVVGVGALRFRVAANGSWRGGDVLFLGDDEVAVGELEAELDGFG